MVLTLQATILGNKPKTMPILSCRRFNNFVDLFLACISVGKFLLYSDQTLSTIFSMATWAPWIKTQHILQRLDDP